MFVCVSMTICFKLQRLVIYLIFRYGLPEDFLVKGKKANGFSLTVSLPYSVTRQVVYSASRE